MPFTSAVTTIARGGDGSTVEVVQRPTDSLPRLLGADAVFVPAPDRERWDHLAGILDYGKLPKEGLVRVGLALGQMRADYGSISSNAKTTGAPSLVYPLRIWRTSLYTTLFPHRLVETTTGTTCAWL
jgi:hypothetical protein